MKGFSLLLPVRLLCPCNCGRCRRRSNPKDEDWRLLTRRPIGVFTMRNDLTEGLIFLACLLSAAVSVLAYLLRG